MRLRAIVKKFNLEGLNKKDRLAVIYMPILMVLLTALLGTGIGVWFQDRSFRRNELFKAKLDRIMAAQKEVVDINTQVEGALRQIRANEDFIQAQIAQQRAFDGQQQARQFYAEQDNMTSSLTVLRETKIRLDALASYSKTLSTESGVGESIKVYSEELLPFIKCVENNDYSVNCSDKYPKIIESLRSIIIAHSKVADDLINSYQ